MPAFSLPVCRSVLITSGKKPCLVAGTACRHRKLPPPWPTSKSTPRLRAAMTYGSTWPCSLTIGKRPRTWPYMCVRMSPGPQVLVEEVVERQRREVAAEVDHHRHVGLRAGLDGAVDRVPVAAVVVRHLDPDDQALVLEDAHRRQPGVHVGQVLLGRPALHPRPDDVDEGEDARLRRVDDVGLELVEVAPAGAAHVDQRRLAAAERVAVGRDGRQPVAQVGVGLGAVEDVRVQVDEARARRRGRRHRRSGRALAASIDGATSAILPSAIATSITPSRPFFGSRTWPPLISSEYAGCAPAGTTAPRLTARARIAATNTCRRVDTMRTPVARMTSV